MMRHLSMMIYLYSTRWHVTTPRSLRHRAGHPLAEEAIAQRMPPRNSCATPTCNGSSARRCAVVL